MIGVAISEGSQTYQCYRYRSPRPKARRHYIVRDWSAKKNDVPVRAQHGIKHVAVAPAESVTIINANGDCFYAARHWFSSDPVDTDEWAKAAWKFLLSRKAGKVGR